MTVREVMNTDLQVIQPDQTIVEAARMMRDCDFGAVPVCENDRVIGMITDRDITVRVVAEAKDPENCQVRDVMTAESITCLQDDKLEDVAQLMADRQIHRLPVVDENQKIVGIVSVGDVAIANQDQAAEALGGISEQRHDEPTQTLHH